MSAGSGGRQGGQRLSELDGGGGSSSSRRISEGKCPEMSSELADVERLFPRWATRLGG